MRPALRAALRLTRIDSAASFSASSTAVTVIEAELLPRAITSGLA